MFWRVSPASQALDDASSPELPGLAVHRTPYGAANPSPTGLRGVYDPTTYGPIASLGFQLLPGAPIQVDGSDFHPTVLDFGPGSVDAWLAWLVASELGISEEHLLDAENRRLILDGEPIDLTPLEWGVMALLVERKGQAVTRRAILERVWGYDHAAAGSNVVEVVVASLRRKLGDRAGIVETVRGLGYRLRD